jgi:hypothetical protein
VCRNATGIPAFFREVVLTIESARDILIQIIRLKRAIHLEYIQDNKENRYGNNGIGFKGSVFCADT